MIASLTWGSAKLASPIILRPCQAWFSAPFVFRRGLVTMLFRKRFWAGLEDGSVTLAFRRWERSRVVAGRRRRTPVGLVDVLAVDEVDVAAITADDARRAGYASVEEVRGALGPDDGRPVFRIEFRRVPGPDPRAELAADADLDDAVVAEIDARLERLDRASRHGPWTMTTLELIASRPEVRAEDLAALVGREKPPFKLDVRKLKNLGLTESLRVGYRLSPRGRSYLSATKRGGAARLSA
jgi:hypothetical protein